MFCLQMLVLRKQYLICYYHVTQVGEINISAAVNETDGSNGTLNTAESVLNANQQTSIQTVEGLQGQTDTETPLETYTIPSTAVIPDL